MGILDNIGKKWTDSDIDELKINYTENNLSVYKLSIIYKRTMYAILCQLKKLNLIVNLEEANGFDEYNILKDIEKDNLNHIKNDSFKNDYLDNNFSLEDLSSKYNISDVQVLKKLFKCGILKNSDKEIYDDTINKTTKLNNMHNDIQEIKNDIANIKNDISEFKNKFNILINILTKK